MLLQLLLIPLIVLIRIPCWPQCTRHRLGLEAPTRTVTCAWDHSRVLAVGATGVLGTGQDVKFGTLDNESWFFGLGEIVFEVVLRLVDVSLLIILSFSLILNVLSMQGLPSPFFLKTPLTLASAWWLGYIRCHGLFHLVGQISFTCIEDKLFYSYWLSVLLTQWLGSHGSAIRTRLDALVIPEPIIFFCSLNNLNTH